MTTDKKKKGTKTLTSTEVSPKSYVYWNFLSGQKGEEKFWVWEIGKSGEGNFGKAGGLIIELELLSGCVSGGMWETGRNATQ